MHRLSNHPHNNNAYMLSPSGHHPLKRSRTPYDNDPISFNGAPGNDLIEKDTSVEDAKKAHLQDLYLRTEHQIARLFDGKQRLWSSGGDDPGETTTGKDGTAQVELPPPQPPKRAVRTITEDDYGDEEEDEEESQETRPAPISPLQARNAPTFKINDAPTTPILTPSLSRISTITSLPEPAKTSEEARKQLEEEKKAAQDAAKESFQAMFYTLENDRDAMLEQQKLDELDRQVEAEAAGEEAEAAKGDDNDNDNTGPRQGTLSNTNLGAATLTLKHLIGRIDAKRIMVQASDQQLRSLMSEVRKNRSKWANEERVGQEELYESAERVLMELKARTEWSAPFLQKVNKREAPDYYHVIKHPMDIGTMLKKLKGLQYHSKKEFCSDLDLIWNNCFRYNANPEHVLRKKAEHMKRETAKLTPLIPDITIRSRAEVEAEEKRLQTDFDDGEESDDEPLKTTRGRKAPGKSSKKGASTARKAPPTDEEAIPAPDAKAQGTLANLKNEHLRGDADSTREGSLVGFSTPPRGDTPALNGAASQADASEMEVDATMIGSQPTEELEQEDDEYKTWKQVTKQDRAQVAASRHRLFKGDKLNAEEPALLRSKAGMRRWMKQQKSRVADNAQESSDSNAKPDAVDGATTSLQEEIADADDSVLPDYYDPLVAVPQINETISWKEDVDGHIIEQREECLRVVPEGYFTSPQGRLPSKISTNMRQMQETRKIVAKIAIVKQMQVQTQTYQNQFQKYEPSPFVEADIPPTVVSDEGPIMDSWICRAALRRSVGKLFYHAGFEEFQPSALDVVTDMAADYFSNLVHTITTYTETVPKVYQPIQSTSTTSTSTTTTKTQALTAPIPRPLKPRFTLEESVLHTLESGGHDLEALSYYTTEEIDRLTKKLEAQHTRTRDYLAELLRPALDPTMVGQDGVGAFNDNSDQFVGGDFAEDIDEDFFGFRELGLDKEFGLAGLSVPLHLLQSRIQTAQPGANVSIAAAVVKEAPPAYPPVTYDSLPEQIGLVQDFFRRKLDALAAGKDEEEAMEVRLVEDDELPVKQRFPKPRLPPTGKISSPRKRPIREQQMMARKKRRLEIEAQREKERGSVGGAGGPGEGRGKSTTVERGEEGGSVSGAGGQDGDVSMLDVNGGGDGNVSPTTTVMGVGGDAGVGTMKPVSKLKFEVPQEGGAGAGTGDPAKSGGQQKISSSSGGGGGGGGGDEDEDDAGAGQNQSQLNGVLSPIAAH